MKKIIAVALLSAVIAVPAVAADTADTSAKASTQKSAPAQHKQERKMKTSDMSKMKMEDECENENGMDEHHMHSMGGMMGMMGMKGMMGEFGGDSMMMPHMGMYQALDLTDEQRPKIKKLLDEMKHNNWATMGLINDEVAKLRDLYEADKRDSAAIGMEYQKIFDLKRQMIVACIDTDNRIEEILTPEQRAKLKDKHHGMHHMHEHSMHEHPMYENPMHEHSMHW